MIAIENLTRVLAAGTLTGMETDFSQPNTKNLNINPRFNAGISPAFSMPKTNLTGLVHPAQPNAIESDDCEVHEALRKFIFEAKHPCVGASAALNKDQYWLGVYDRLASTEASLVLARDLNAYLREQEQNPREFATFIAAFRDQTSLTEVEFEKGLWSQLSQLDRISSVFHDWDPTTSPDPGSEKFSFSFGGKAFYVVGLHPNSSRMARSFPYPALVFNLHSQFEALRTSGKYGRMRDTIRSRDQKLQGTTNPMISDFGTASEARQYSGRAVDKEWKCPFHSATKKAQVMDEESVPE